MQENLLHREKVGCMKVSQALLARKSCRAYLPQAVEEEDIRQILHFARQAPSGTNSQPWQVAAISGVTKKTLDAKLLQAFQSGAPKHPDYNYYPLHLSPEMQQKRVACAMQLYESIHIDRDDITKRLEQWALNYSAFNAPCALFFFMDGTLEKGSYMDLGMFLQSVMLMAEELGLATCPQAALAEYPSIVKDLLGYPQDTILLCGMALGVEDKEAAINGYRTPRDPVDAFTKFFN